MKEKEELISISHYKLVFKGEIDDRFSSEKTRPGAKNHIISEGIPKEMEVIENGPNNYYKTNNNLFTIEEHVVLSIKRAIRANRFEIGFLVGDKVFSNKSTKLCVYNIERKTFKDIFSRQNKKIF